MDAPAGTNDAAFTYDLLNRRLTACFWISSACAQTLTSTWDALGRNLSETGPLGAMSWQYDLAGRRTRMTWPDAVYVNYGWDLDGAMRSLTLGAAATPVAAWAYDNLGQRTSITRGNGVTTTYVLDNASYLTSLAHNPSGATNDLTLGFAWSPAGQALSRSMSNAAYALTPVNATTAYANNGLNQNTVVGGATLTWSAQGNLTSDGTKTFTYDAANRLTGTTGSALTYDPLDRLYQMTGTGAGRFQYDGSQLAAVYPAGSTTVAERYVGGPVGDEWAVIYTGSGTAAPVYPLQNQQGSVIALTDASGSATSTLAYDEYGRPRTGNTGRFQYTGQMWLPDFGLYHYKARAYHPGLGRFLQTDPVGYEQGLNLYAYVGNDPLNSTDPNGREIKSTSSVVTGDDGKTVTTVTIEFTAALRTAGGQRPRGVSERSLADRIEDQIEEDYAGRFEDENGNITEYVTNATITVGEATGTQHSILILARGDPRVGDRGGSAPAIGSMEMYISDATLANRSQFNRTGSHEFGHAAGLVHPPGRPPNIMTQSVYIRRGEDGHAVTPNQLLYIWQRHRR